MRPAGCMLPTPTLKDKTLTKNLKIQFQIQNFWWRLDV
jgi:hypothetical protein